VTCLEVLGWYSSEETDGIHEKREPRVKYSGLEHCHHSHFFRARMKKDGCPS